MSKVAGSVFFLIIVHCWGDFFLKVPICIGKLGLLNSSQVSSVSPDITFMDPDPKVKIGSPPPWRDDSHTEVCNPDPSLQLERCTLQPAEGPPGYPKGTSNLYIYIYVYVHIYTETTHDLLSSLLFSQLFQLIPPIYPTGNPDTYFLLAADPIPSKFWPLYFLNLPGACLPFSISITAPLVQRTIISSLDQFKMVYLHLPSPKLFTEDTEKY